MFRTGILSLFKCLPEIDDVARYCPPSTRICERSMFEYMYTSLVVGEPETPWCLSTYLIGGG